jgi:hypothetical protein
MVSALNNGGYLISISGNDGGAGRGYVWFAYDSTDALLSGPNPVNQSGFWSYGTDGLISLNGYVLSVSHYNNAAWNVGLDVINSNGAAVLRLDVPTNGAGIQYTPEITSLADGERAVIVWSDDSGQLDGSGFGVYARVFSTATLSFVASSLF